jgi:hypothetical protein
VIVAPSDGASSAGCAVQAMSKLRISDHAPTSPALVTPRTRQ